MSFNFNKLIRLVLLLFFIVFVVFFFVIYNLSSYVIGFFIILILFNYKFFFSFRNYFLMFCYLLFCVSAPIHDPERENEFLIDMLLFILAYLLGEVVYIKSNKSYLKYLAIDSNIVQHLKFIVILNTIIIIVTIILDGGIKSYLSGEVFIKRIENYNQLNVFAAIITIVTSVLYFVMLSLISLYVRQSLRGSKHLNYKLLIYCLVILPLIEFQRSKFAFGVISILFINYCVNLQKNHSPFKFIAKSTSVLSILLVGTLGLGMLRTFSFSGDYDIFAQDTNLIFTKYILGELESVKAYIWIKDEVEKEGVQYGRTIIIPFAMKIIPRSLYPDKPLNSGAYFSSKSNYSSFIGGFMIPSTFFGDFYLNFGLWGVMFACFCLGCLCNVLEIQIMKRDFSIFHLHFVTFVFFYSLLRNDFSNSMTMILFTFLTFKGYYFVIKHYYRSNFNKF